MPPLNEGTLLYMPTAPPGMSITEAGARAAGDGPRLKSVPEVESVFGKMGRADTATDPAPLGMVETDDRRSSPRTEWRPGHDLGRAGAGARRALVHLPGMPNLWWMPIQTRNEMLADRRAQPGRQSRSSATISQRWNRAALDDRARGRARCPARAVRSPSGSPAASTSTSTSIATRPRATASRVRRRQRCRRSGDRRHARSTRSSRDASATRSTVRYARDLRDDPDARGACSCRRRGGAQMPLSDRLRRSRITVRPADDPQRGRQAGRPRVRRSPASAPIADYVRRRRARSAREEVAAAAGRARGWAGQFQLPRARAGRARVRGAADAALVALLLYLNTRSGVETAIVLLAVPFSLVGAVWLLWLARLPPVASRCGSA